MKFEATGTKTELVSVHLTEAQAKDLIKDYVNKKFGISMKTYVDHEGNLCEDIEEWYGSHSSWEKQVIRVATETDLIMLQALSLMLKSKIS